MLAGDVQRAAVGCTWVAAAAHVVARSPLSLTRVGRVSSAAVTGQPELDPEVRRRANRAALKYGLARLVLFVVLTVIIQLLATLIGAPVPVVMSALFALILAFPLSMLVFSGMRQEATEAVAAWSQQRKDRKAWVRDELSSR